MTRIIMFGQIFQKSKSVASSVAIAINESLYPIPLRSQLLT
ncbi:hypothetical protein EV144_101103 [Flavobacterium sp. 270]|nr:hypothetical protein EV144_101103 [Flavobacterium sp. 270]